MFPPLLLRRAAWLGVLLAWAACAGPEVAVQKKFDFRKVKRVAVLEFSGQGGGAASDLMTQALLARGADVVERKQLDALVQENRLSATGLLDPGTIKQMGQVLGVDALILGSVNSYSQPQSYLVFTGSDHPYPAVTALNSGSVYSQGPAPGLSGADVITSAAVVGLTARMVDVETGSILWSASQTYEGIDADSAMRPIADGFGDSLRTVWLSKLASPQ